MKPILRLLISAVAFWVAAELLAVDDGLLSWLVGDGNGIVLAEDRFSGAWFLTLVVVALVFGVANAVLQPIIKTAGCLLYLVTFGLISLVVNGALLLLSTWIAGSLLDLDFRLEGSAIGIFWTAIVAALIISIVSTLLNLVLRTRR